MPGEQLGPVPPGAQHGGDDGELGGVGVVQAGHMAGVEAVQQVGAGVEVHGAAVVRVHEGGHGQLGALVDVRHAGGGELDELVAELDHEAGLGDAVRDRLHGAARGAVRCGDGAGEILEAALELRVLVRPGGGQGRLPGCLLQEAQDPLGRGGGAVRGPHAHDRLPQQALGALVPERVQGAQPRQLPRPALGLLGEDRDPGADVLTALGVVRAQGGHGGGPGGLAGLLRRVERVEGQLHVRGVPADLVEVGPAGPAIERAVLHALGHHHAGGLLEAAGHRGVGVRELGAEVRQHGREGRLGLARVRERALEHGKADGQVRAVHGQPGEDGGERGGHVRVRVGAERVHAADLADQAGGLGGERAGGHVPLGLGHHLVPVATTALVLVRAAGRDGVHEDALDLAQGVVAGGAVHVPVGGQLLAGLEDLLHHEVPLGQHVRAQAPHIAGRVGQAVRVVHAQPLDEALADPAGGLGVDGVEDLRVLHPHPGEGGDGEEAAVVQLGVPAAPADEPVVLAGVHRAGQARALGGRLVRGIGPGEDVRGAQPGLLLGGREGAGRQRVARVPVAQPPAVVAGLHHEPVQLGLGLAVGAVAEHGQEHPAVPGGPVHVEPGGVRRLGAVREQVPPGGVRLGGRHAHVVGHDVHEHAEAGLPRRAGDGFETLGAPAGRVQPGGVHHVVPVVRPGLGLEDRGEVEPAHAETPQVGHEPGHGLQGQVGPDRGPVGRGGAGVLGRSAHSATLAEAPDAASGPTDGPAAGPARASPALGARPVRPRR